LGRGDGARGCRDAGAKGDRERAGARGELPLSDDGRAFALPGARRAFPAAPARRHRAGGAGGPGSRGVRQGRRPDELRPIEVVVDYLEQPMGAVLWAQGKTKVLCTASLDEGVPRWLRDSGRGWLTAEYSMLPASTGERTRREASAGKQKGRTVEIQRLIGRSLRAVADMEA